MGATLEDHLEDSLFLPFSVQFSELNEYLLHGSTGIRS